MNIWGTGAFDNDSGKDFIQEVVQDGRYALSEAFEVVLDPDLDLVEAEEGQRAVAAAEILTATLSGDTAQLTDAGLRAWAQQAAPQDFEALRRLAREALERVLGPYSDLPELWEDSADAPAWRSGVQQLRQRLSV